MKPIANSDQYNAWNGESGTRWVADADHANHAGVHLRAAIWIITARTR